MVDYQLYDHLKIKLLIIGGNRNFGYELIKKILYLNKIELFVINRNGKNLKKLEDYNRITHFKIDRTNQEKLISIVTKYKINLVLDNIAYDLPSIKQFLNFLHKKNIIYIFTSTVLTSFYIKNNFKNKQIENLIKKKYFIERYLASHLTNFIILKLHNILSPYDNSDRTKSIIFFNLENLNNNKLRSSDKVQFININDLVKVVYNLISKKNLKKIIRTKKIYHITNKFLSLKNLSLLNYKSNIKRNINFDDTFLKNIIIKNDIIDKRIKIDNSLFKKLEDLRKSFKY